MNLQEIKDNWENLDKSSFTENIEIEYDDDDPVFLQLKSLAEEANMDLSEFLSALLFDWFKNEIVNEENQLDA